MNQPTTSDTEPTITLPLRDFLQVLWGYKWTGILGDRRERAYPGDNIIKLLEQQIPADVAARYFKIVRPQPSVDAVVWEVNEWQMSGAAEAEAQAKNDNFQYASDKLTDYLMQHVPMCNIIGRATVRTMTLQVVQLKNWDILKPFGLSDELIEDLKTGRYNNNV